MNHNQPKLPANVRRSSRHAGFDASLTRSGTRKVLGTFETAGRAHIAVRLALHWISKGVRPEDLPNKITWCDI